MGTELSSSWDQARAPYSKKKTISMLDSGVAFSFDYGLSALQLSVCLCICLSVSVSLSVCLSLFFIKTRAQ